MHTEQPDTSSNLLLLLDALRLLPGVKPMSVRNRLGEAKYWAGRAPQAVAQFEGVPLKLAELEQLFIMDDQGRPCVSRTGAALLVDLYERGVFDCTPARNASGNLDLLVRYSRGESVVLDKPARVRTPRQRRVTPAPCPPARQPDRPNDRLSIDYAALTIHRLA
jgi:hypothetical protein